MDYNESGEEWGGIHSSNNGDSVNSPSSSPDDRLDSSPSVPLSVAFDLGRLPCELRAKIITEVATCEEEEDWDLLLVSKEFHWVVAPILYEVSPRASYTLPSTTLMQFQRFQDVEFNCRDLRPYSLGLFAMTVLPRYGSMIRHVEVKSVGKRSWEREVYDHLGAFGQGDHHHDSDDDQGGSGDNSDGGSDDDYSYDAEEPYHHGQPSPLTPACETEVLVANIIVNLPNLASLTLSFGGLPHIVATSPHLASLTYLELSGSLHEDPRGAAGAISLISGCTNIETITLRLYELGPTNYPLLMAALASRRYLTTLLLPCPDFLDDNIPDLNWECPLSGLEIETTYYTPEFMLLANFRKFIANFSNTLKSLSLCAPIAPWAQPTIVHVPFPLPHLTQLSLWDNSETTPLPSDPYQLFRLFDDSPIVDTNLNCGPRHPDDDRSVTDSLRVFIQRHETTLKTMVAKLVHLSEESYSVNEQDEVDLEKYAVGVGIDFTMMR
jgi:hypothetical protein